MTIVSQGQLSQSSHQTLSPIKHQRTGAAEQGLRTISACLINEKYVKSSTQKEGIKVVSGARQLSGELEIDFYNQWGKSVKELRVQDPAGRGSRANSQSNSECTFKGKAQTSQPQRCGATSFGMAPAALAATKVARGTSKSRKSRSRLSKHEEQQDAVAAAMLIGAGAGVSASAGNLPVLRGPLRKRNGAAKRDSIQSQGTDNPQNTETADASTGQMDQGGVKQKKADKGRPQLGGEEQDDLPASRLTQQSRSDLNMIQRQSSKSRQNAATRLLGKPHSRDSGKINHNHSANDGQQSSVTPQKTAGALAGLGLRIDAGLDFGSLQGKGKAKHAKPLKSLMLPPENLGAEVAQLKKQAETSTKNELLRRKKHQQLVNRASIDSCKQQPRKVNNFMAGPLDRHVGSRLLGKQPQSTLPMSSTSANNPKNILSKEQIQLMKHFEKQQQIQQLHQNQQQAMAHELERKAAFTDGKIGESKSKKKLLMTDQQSSNFNRKNVIENYFQIGGGSHGAKTIHPRENSNNNNGRPRGAAASEGQGTKSQQKQRTTNNQRSKKSRERSREKSIETRIAGSGLAMAAGQASAGSYQMMGQAQGTKGRHSNANVYSIGGNQLKSQTKKVTSSSIEKSSGLKNQRHGSIGSQLGQIIDKHDNEAANEGEPGDLNAQGDLKAQTRLLQLQNFIVDESNTHRGAEDKRQAGKQSKSQLHNSRQTLSLNQNQMSEPSRKTNHALQKALKLQSNQVLKFEKSSIEQATTSGGGAQASVPTSVSSEITPKSQNMMSKMKFEALKNSALGIGGTTQQHKVVALKNLEKLARYQSMPEDAGEVSSARAHIKKGIHKSTKHRNAAEMLIREKNKSAEKLKKSAGAESSNPLSGGARSKAAGTRPQNQQMTQKSVLHSSTSQLEQFSMSHEALSMIVNNQKKQAAEIIEDNMMLMIDDAGEQVCPVSSGPPGRIHWNEEAMNLPHRTKGKKSLVKPQHAEQQHAALGQGAAGTAFAEEVSSGHPNNINDSGSSRHESTTGPRSLAQPTSKQHPTGFQGTHQLQRQHLKSQKILQGGVHVQKKDSNKGKANQTNKASSISAGAEAHVEDRQERLDTDQKSDQNSQKHLKSRPATKKHNAHTTATKKATAKITRTRSKDRDQQAISVKKNEPRASLQKQVLFQAAPLPPGALQGDTAAMKRQILENAKLLQFNSNLLVTSVQSPKDPAEVQKHLQALGEQMYISKKDLNQGGHQQQQALRQLGGNQSGKAEPRTRQVKDLAATGFLPTGEGQRQMYNNHQLLSLGGAPSATMQAKHPGGGPLANQAPPLIKARSQQVTDSKQDQLDEMAVPHAGARVQGQNLAKKKFQTLINEKPKMGQGAGLADSQPQTRKNQPLLSNFSSLPLQMQQKQQAMNMRSLGKVGKAQRKNVDYFKTNEKESKANNRTGNGSGLQQVKPVAGKARQKMMSAQDEKIESPEKPKKERMATLGGRTLDYQDEDAGQPDHQPWHWTKEAVHQLPASALSQKSQDNEQHENTETEPILVESMTMPQAQMARQGAASSQAGKGLSTLVPANNTAIGGASLIGHQQTAPGSLGLTTTFLQSGGNLCNANTTASSNTMLLNNKSLTNQFMQNQTNLTAGKSNDPRKSMLKIQNLLQKTQMVERRRKHGSNNLRGDCSGDGVVVSELDPDGNAMGVEEQKQQAILEERDADDKQEHGGDDGSLLFRDSLQL